MINNKKNALLSDQKQFQLVKEIINKLDKNKKYKLIDIGGGKNKLKEILPSNVSYDTVDVSGDPTFIVDLDKSKIPVKDKSYDFVVCTETLEHTLYPDNVMHEILRISKDNATFILSMPNEFNFWLRIKYLFNQKPKNQETFKTTSKHLHIHLPRYMDIIHFFSNYIIIEKEVRIWQSRHSSLGKMSGFYNLLDSIIDKLANVFPGLFARLVAVRGRRK